MTVQAVVYLYCTNTLPVPVPVLYLPPIPNWLAVISVTESRKVLLEGGSTESTGTRVPYLYRWALPQGTTELACSTSRYGTRTSTSSIGAHMYSDTRKCGYLCCQHLLYLFCIYYCASAVSFYTGIYRRNARYIQE